MKQGDKRPPRISAEGKKADWRTVTGFSKYAVNSDGDIKNIRLNAVLRSCPNNTGKYLMVSLWSDDDKKKSKLVHCIVAAEFLPERPSPKHEVNHKDGNRFNPAASNLEWMTRSENHIHAYRVLGRVPTTLGGKRGSEHHAAKLTEDDVREIRRLKTSGAKNKDIATQFGIGPRTVRSIGNGHAWKSVL